MTNPFEQAASAQKNLNSELIRRAHAGDLAGSAFGPRRRSKRFELLRSYGRRSKWPR